jgi:hypothetical protein
MQSLLCNIRDHPVTQNTAAAVEPKINRYSLRNRQLGRLTDRRNRTARNGRFQPRSELLPKEDM